MRLGRGRGGMERILDNSIKLMLSISENPVKTIMSRYKTIKFRLDEAKTERKTSISKGNSIKPMLSTAKTNRQTVMNRRKNHTTHNQFYTVKR